MSTIKLTKRVVDAVAANDRDQFLWDSEAKGFGLRLRHRGAKTLVAQHRAGGGRSGVVHRFTVGRFGVTIVEEAKAEAKRVLGAVARGSDPSGDRHTQRREMSVAQLIDYLADNGTVHLNERNRRWMPARLRHHVVPLLGRMKISKVRAKDVEQFMRDVTVGKTARVWCDGPVLATLNARAGIGSAHLPVFTKR